MRGRPGLITDYRRDMAILPTTTQRAWFVAMAVALVLIGLQLPADLALLGATAAIASVRATRSFSTARRRMARRGS